MHAGNSSCDSQAKLIIRPVVKWDKFCGNQKIATTLICYLRLMQDSHNALSWSRTVKNPFFKLVPPDFWTDLNSCRQRLLFVRQLNSENVASARKVGLNQNLKKTWKGLFQIPLSLTFGEWCPITVRISLLIGCLSFCSFNPTSWHGFASISFSLDVIVFTACQFQLYRPPWGLTGNLSCWLEFGIQQNEYLSIYKYYCRPSICRSSC